MSTPVTHRSVAAAFQATAARYPEEVALRTVADAVRITWREYAERVQAIATGLASLGVGRGDTVALMMVNRPEFHLVDAAAFHLGAVPFSVYNTSSPQQIDFLFTSAKPRVVVCDLEFVPVLRKAEKRSIEHLVCVDGAVEGATTLTELERTTLHDFDFEAAWRSVLPEDLLTLIFTSGTTGSPKGVQITHANMLAEVVGTNTVLEAGHGDRIISFLPSAHIADRWAGHYIQAVCGTQVTCVSDRRQLLAALQDVRPTLFGAVPQVWQKIRAVIEGMIDSEEDAARRTGLQKALDIGLAYTRASQSGDITPDLEAGYRAADSAVFKAIRTKLGLENARIVQSGAAPISADVVEFFNALGIPISDVWGMSELSCVAAIAPKEGGRIGTIGKPLPGVEMRVAHDGELLVRGPIVMKGYLDEPELTAAAIDDDGWLHTGDVGAIDSDGFVRITDRKKELIINAHGKNMSPVAIENAVRARSSLIGQVVTIGDNRPYNVGLIVLEQDAAQQYAASRGLSADAQTLSTDPGVIDIVQRAVDEANATLSRVEQLKKISILPVYWEPGSDVLTHTMKLRRRPIAEQYAAEIDALYEVSTTQATVLAR